eukprot:CAMPEP_0201502288 /NCGR_PEP_ID=MMETSP0151_2-20130828/84052_1 /ASSEMBLY_ACC=CAM_ASM_000257 /TAXON_ID=200890 /ORGANISM="Paramoeba atlantica, Strain 621/1 / CCAP 1560/9" /LENGTH=835 /DNA_ID=CAMNT_0047895869 /DNA_START=1243 /DNA_END=3749 /DNA_ORIENTATION=-
MALVFKVGGESCAENGQYSDVFLVEKQQVSLVVQALGEIEGDFFVTVSKIPPPSNDLCDNSERLLINAPTKGSITHSSTSSNILAPCDHGSQSPDIFYIFTAPTSGLYLFSVCGDDGEHDFWAKISLFGGSCSQPICTPQSHLSCSQIRPEGIVLKELDAGHEVRVVVYGNSSHSRGDFTLSVTLSQKPEGFSCEAPVEIETNKSVEGMTLYLGEEDESSMCGGKKETMMRSYYLFVPPVSGWYHVNFTSHTGAQHEMNLVTSCSLDKSSCIGNKPGTYFLAYETLIVMSSRPEYVGRFNLLVSSFEPIASNSYCSKPISFDLNETLTGNTKYAVGIDRKILNTCEAAGHKNPKPGLFYKFRAPRKSLYRFKINLLSNIELLMFAAVSGTCNTPILLDCDASQNGAEISTLAEEGEKITIFVATSSPGEFAISSSDALPPNVDCHNAVPLLLGVSTSASSLDTQNALAGDNFLNCLQDNVIKSTNPLFFRFTAPKKGVYFIRGNTDKDTRFDIYTGSCDLPVCLPLNHLHQGEKYFEMEKGKTVFIKSVTKTKHSKFFFSIAVDMTVPPSNVVCPLSKEIFEGRTLHDQTALAASSHHPDFVTCDNKNSLHQATGMTAHPPLLFYKFTPKVSGFYTIEKDPVGWIGVYTGGCGNPRLLQQFCLAKYFHTPSVELKKDQTVVITAQDEPQDRSGPKFTLSVTLQDEGHHHSGSQVGVIVGSVLGGVTGLFLMILVGLLVFKKCKRDGGDKSPEITATNLQLILSEPTEEVGLSKFQDDLFGEREEDLFGERQEEEEEDFFGDKEGKLKTSDSENAPLFGGEEDLSFEDDDDSDLFS